MAGNNWGVGFWRSYNLKASAKAMRAEYAKWLQDVNDREAADKILKSTMQTIEEKSVRRKELERELDAMRQERALAQSELDEQRKAGTLSDEEWSQSTMRLSEQHNIAIAPRETEWANEVTRIATHLADQAITLTRDGGANHYIQDVAKNLFETSNRLGVVLATGAEQRKAAVDDFAAMQAEQSEMSGREARAREGAVELEGQRHAHRMGEIEAQKAGRAGGGGGAAQKAKSPPQEATAGQAPEATPGATPATPADRFSQANEAQAKLQEALSLVEQELSDTPGLAGVDPKSDDYKKRMAQDDKLAKQEERRQQLLEMKAKYEALLSEVRQKGEASREEAFSSSFDEFDKSITKTMEGLR